MRLLAGPAWALGLLTLVLWVVSGVQFLGKMQGWEEAMFALGSLYPPYFRHGFWWTPLSHIFLHSGLLHIFMNTTALVSFRTGDGGCAWDATCAGRCCSGPSS